MAAYNAIGRLVEIFDTVEITDKFKKREFVIEIEDGKYSQFPKFQTIQGNTELLDGFAVGDKVEVTFSLGGKKWESGDKVNWFTNLNAWKIVSAYDDELPLATPEAKIEDNDIPF